MSPGSLSRTSHFPHKCNSTFPFKHSVMLNNAMEPLLPKQNPSCHLSQCPLHPFPSTHHQDMLFLQISFLLAFSTLFLFRSHLYFITTTLGSFNWSLSLLSYPLLYLHRWYWYFHVFFPSLMMPRHLASMCESCEKSSSLSPGNHENLQSYSFPPLLRNFSSTICGKKSISTVKTIHNLVLP